jgi:uroporphyrinogen-III decarboxylase
VKLGLKVKEAMPHTPIIMFPKGQTNPEVIRTFLNFKTEKGLPLFDGFNLDHSVDDEVITLILKENRTIQGNIEPGVII